LFRNQPRAESRTVLNDVAAMSRIEAAQANQQAPYQEPADFRFLLILQCCFWG
jgi:hypothetical protein